MHARRRGRALAIGALVLGGAVFATRSNTSHLVTVDEPSTPQTSTQTSVRPNVGFVTQGPSAGAAVVSITGQYGVELHEESAECSSDERACTVRLRGPGGSVVTARAERPPVAFGPEDMWQVLDLRSQGLDLTISQDLTIRVTSEASGQLSLLRSPTFFGEERILADHQGIGPDTPVVVDAPFRVMPAEGNYVLVTQVDADDGRKLIDIRPLTSGPERP